MCVWKKQPPAARRVPVVRGWGGEGGFRVPGVMGGGRARWSPAADGDGAVGAELRGRLRAGGAGSCQFSLRRGGPPGPCPPP